jgi:hypothetical protein
MLGDTGHLGEIWGGQSKKQKAQGRNPNHRPPGFHACCAPYIGARPNMRQDISVTLHPARAIECYILGHHPMARRYARWRIHSKPPSWLRPRRQPNSEETSGDPGETPGGPKAIPGVSESAPKELRATSIPEGAAAGSAEGNPGARRRTLWALGATPEGPRRDSEGLVGVTPRGFWRRTAGTAGATLRLCRQHRG